MTNKFIDPSSYARYRHTIKAAYNSLGLADSVTDDALNLASFDSIPTVSFEETLELFAIQIKGRLSSIDIRLGSEFLDTPRYREVFFNNQRLVIPILNQQSVEWYEQSSLYNFDFLMESFQGMHHQARIIYDIGGHQGVWSAFYAIVCRPLNGRVYCFEPSIINVECSALLFLLNSIDNVINVPYGIGDKTCIVEKSSSGLLIDFVEHSIGLLRFQDIFWEPADFIKIDIEGFEYEFVSSFSNIFDFCKNVHLELHIPHLERRSLNYQDILEKIPFDQVEVVNYQHGTLVEVVKGQPLEGYCSLLIRPNT